MMLVHGGSPAQDLLQMRGGTLGCTCWRTNVLTYAHFDPNVNVFQDSAPTRSDMLIFSGLEPYLRVPAKGVQVFDFFDISAGFRQVGRVFVTFWYLLQCPAQCGR